MREWVSDKDRRWVMRCDEPGCKVQTEPEDRQPSLEQLAGEGWFIARLAGDRCPSHFSKSTTQPHMVMTEARDA